MFTDEKDARSSIALEEEILSTAVDDITKDKDFYAEIIEKLQLNIDELQKNDSENTVLLADGTTSFSIPGGGASHAISYEFQRDTLGDFYFIIHNRGYCCNDSELHGTLEITDPSTGKIYKRTSTKIHCPQELLKDRVFLKNLIADLLSGTMETTYQHIKGHLLGKEGVEIVVSQKEQEIITLLASLKDMKKVLSLVHSSRDIHSIQMYGTCSESNFTAAEKNMASLETIRAEKCYRISQILDSLSSSIRANVLSQLLYRQDFKAIKKHSITRIAGLQNKISNG